MTERLINWSLSDTVTRVIVRVGVAYGSDLELTRTLLKQAADDNSRVLKDPAPSSTSSPSAPALWITSCASS